MRQPGRKSAAQLAVISPRGLETIRRPEPPQSLNDEEAMEWRKVVGGMAADHFPAETHAMLEARCRHVIESRQLAQMLEAEKKSNDYDWKTHRELIYAQTKLSQTIAMLDTKLRLAQITIYDRRTQPKSAKATPWQTTQD
jgi:hypothetical protein